MAIKYVTHRRFNDERHSEQSHGVSQVTVVLWRIWKSLQLGQILQYRSGQRAPHVDPETRWTPLPAKTTVPIYNGLIIHWVFKKKFFLFSPQPLKLSDLEYSKSSDDPCDSRWVYSMLEKKKERVNIVIEVVYSMHTFQVCQGVDSSERPWKHWVIKKLPRWPYKHSSLHVCVCVWCGVWVNGKWSIWDCFRCVIMHFCVNLNVLYVLQLKGRWNIGYWTCRTRKGTRK